MDEIELERIAGEIVDAAVKLHKRVGPGLLESVYEVLLARELHSRGLDVECQKPVSVTIDGIHFDNALRLDMLVNGVIVIEIKSVHRFTPAHWKQVLTYLRLLDLRLRFLINFGDATLKDGLKRVVNRYEGFGPSRLGVRTM